MKLGEVLLLAIDLGALVVTLHAIFQSYKIEREIKATRLAAKLSESVYDDN